MLFSFVVDRYFEYVIWKSNFGHALWRILIQLDTFLDLETKSSVISSEKKAREFVIF